ncbi:MAG: DUF983 domain-containing protein [Candidatus Rokubacteria bacterium]|nr:DUF983 domain-containing protein [Candidatus Rokubacteria bacterium]
MPFERGLGRSSGQVLGRALRLQCLRCGGTPLFRGWFRMPATCALCGLRFERAQGYWVGAIYLNYGVTVVLAVTGHLVLWRWWDVSARTQLWIWLPFTGLFPLWFFRYSRSLWLAVEYLLNPEL